MLKKFLAGITSILILFSAGTTVTIANGTRNGVITTISEMRSDATIYEEDGRLVITSEGAVKVEKGDKSLIKNDNSASGSPDIPDGFGNNITAMFITLESESSFTFDFGKDAKNRFSSFTCSQNDNKTDANIMITRKESQSLFDDNYSILVGTISGNLNQVKVKYIQYVSGYGETSTLLGTNEIKNGFKKEYNINNIFVATEPPVVSTTTKAPVLGTATRPSTSTNTAVTTSQRIFTSTVTTVATIESQETVPTESTVSTARPTLTMPTVPPTTTKATTTTTTTTTTAEPTTVSTTEESTTVPETEESTTTDTTKRVRRTTTTTSESQTTTTTTAEPTTTSATTTEDTTNSTATTEETTTSATTAKATTNSTATTEETTTSATTAKA
ncbi:MAG: hypothetical protein K2L10_09275, partial [Ruminococcus sp.]|nr:hypothetical protein [Ruminococcus sp.]